MIGSYDISPRYITLITINSLLTGKQILDISTEIALLFSHLFQILNDSSTLLEKNGILKYIETILVLEKFLVEQFTKLFISYIYHIFLNPCYKKQVYFESREIVSFVSLLSHLFAVNT